MNTKSITNTMNTIIYIAFCISLLSAPFFIHAQTANTQTTIHDAAKQVQNIQDINGDGIHEAIIFSKDENGKAVTQIFFSGDIQKGILGLNQWETISTLFLSFFSFLAFVASFLWFFYNRLHNKIMGIRKEMKEEIQQVKTEMKEEIQQVKTEMKEEIQQVRIEIKEEIQQVKTEMKEEIQQVRIEMKEEIQQVRIEMKEEIKASEQRINARMDKTDIEIKEIKQEIKEVKNTLTDISQILIEIKTRLNTEDRLIPFLTHNH